MISNRTLYCSLYEIQNKFSLNSAKQGKSQRDNLVLIPQVIEDKAKRLEVMPTGYKNFHENGALLRLMLVKV